jgi:phosphoenolpyruvate carboxylase
MTSWYGLGTALQSLEKEKPEAYTALKGQCGEEPFLKYVLQNVDNSVGEVDESIMAAYAALVEDESIRERFLKMFREELLLVRQQLDQLLGGDYESRHPRRASSNEMRSVVLQPLHRHQIALLERWRAEKARGAKQAAHTQMELMLTINAIAGAIGTTG